MRSGWRIDQDRQQRYILMRLDAPAPGVVLFGTYDFGAHIVASMTMYFYGDGAETRAAASGQRWRDWFAAIGPDVLKSA